MTYEDYLPGAESVKDHFNEMSSNLGIIKIFLVTSPVRENTRQAKSRILSHFLQIHLLWRAVPVYLQEDRGNVRLSSLFLFRETLQDCTDSEENCLYGGVFVSGVWIMVGNSGSLSLNIRNIHKGYQVTYYVKLFVNIVILD